MSLSYKAFVRSSHSWGRLRSGSAWDEVDRLHVVNPAYGSVLVNLLEETNAAFISRKLTESTVREIKHALTVVVHDWVYRPLIALEFPQAEHSTKGRKKGSEHDPLYILNQKCAKARNDNARLTRKSWCASKRAWGLQMQLNLFIAAENRYNMKVPAFGKYTGQQFRTAYRLYCQELQERYPFTSPDYGPPDLSKKLNCRRERVREELQREFIAYGWREKDFEF